MPRDREAFGEYLRDVRQSRGLSIRALADLCGINYTFVSHIEDGRKSPSQDVVVRLAGALSLDAEDLQARALGQLPSLAPYLRARYDLSETQVAELEAHFKAVTKKSPGGKRRRP